MNAQPAPCGAVQPDTGHEYLETCVRPAQHRGDHLGTESAWPRTKTTKRGTSNTNVRGSTRDRRRRRARLVAAWPADVDLVLVKRFDDAVDTLVEDRAEPRQMDGTRHPWIRVPATRCYCCGALLHAGATLTDGTVVEGTVTCDRIVPGAEGGTYAFDNLRPACAAHNSSTGGKLGVARKAAKASS